MSKIQTGIIFLLLLFTSNKLFSKIPLQTLSIHVSNADYHAALKTLTIGNKYYVESTRASFLYQTGNKSESKKIFAALIDKYPDDGLINFYMGLFAYENKDYKKSIFFFENAYITNFQPYHAKLYTSIVKIKQKKYAHAIVDLIEIAEKSPELKQSALFYSGYSKIKSYDKNFTYLLDARKFFDEVIHIDPNTDYSKYAKMFISHIDLLVNNREIKKNFTTVAEIALGYTYDSNLYKDFSSQESNLLNAIFYGYITPYMTENYYLRTSFYNKNLARITLSPDNEPELKSSYRVGASINYFLMDKTKLSLFAAHAHKNNFHESFNRNSIGTRLTTQYLKNFTTCFETGYFNENDTSSIYFSIQQILNFKLSPFFKYTYIRQTASDKLLNNRFDKFLVGFKKNKFLLNFNFLLFYSLGFKRYSDIDSPINPYNHNELYINISKSLSNSITTYLHGALESKNHKNNSSKDTLSNLWTSLGLSISL